MARVRRGSAVKSVVLGLVVVVLLSAFGVARFYTDVLWFNELGVEEVLWRSLGAQFALGALAGLAMALLLFSNLWVAGRLAPTYLPSGRRGDPAERYRELIGPHLGRLRLWISLGIGVLTGIGASTAWQRYLLWANAVEFGVADPQFGRDVGFYVFSLPFLKTVSGWLWFALFVSLLAAGAAYFLQGSIQLRFGLAGVRPAALAHLSVLLGGLAVVKAWQYHLGTFELNFSPRGTVTGASYTDVHAQLPALRLLMVISLISALLFVVNIWYRRLALPLAAVGIWVLTAVLAGGVWPWWVQRFSVAPQEPQREEPYIKRNIEATRAAFGLEDVTSLPFEASSSLPEGAVAGNEDTLQNVRLWDPDVLQLAYQQLQAIRTYYRFEDVDVDRYVIDGQLRQVLLSARELSLEDLPERSKTWQNLHLQYTHGFGIVASLANESTAAGQPRFIVDDVPGVVAPGAESLAAEQARIYYGEGFGAHEYSIVRSRQEELDYPTDEGPERNTYDGKGGIEVSNLLRRVAFALREADPNLLISGLITPESRILLYRNVRDRVLRAAPFLYLDSDPYPAVVDGRLVWILDAFTATRFYPYSERIDAGDVIAQDAPGVLTGRINYVRNSVKVVVDAYDGTTTFYVVEPDDPLIQAWQRVFPELFSDEPPSADLVAHFRYPEDLFTLQSEVYRTYHMTDPFDFYSKEDEWSVAVAPQRGRTAERGPLEPRYLLFRLPGETEQEFMLTRPYTPRGRNNMISLFVARSDPGRYGELLTLQFPRQRVVLGPVQVDNLVNQDVEISQTITLLDQEGSNVSFGALVIVPIEQSLLYVQPLFVTAEDGGIPELKKVVLVLGEDIALGDSFDQALAELFGPVPGSEPSPTPSPGEQPKPEPVGELAELIARAGALYERAQEALRAGDLASYGRLIERLGDVLEELQRAAARPAGT